MKSLRYLSSQEASLPLVADDVLEFHAARLLLLFRVCGTKNRIDGLTKMAKLDFFVRYPDFFAEVSRQLEGGEVAPSSSATESAMIRFHYGPWDPRYYQVLAYLEGRGLLQVVSHNKGFAFSLTASGKKLADQIGVQPSFADIYTRMGRVKKAMGKLTGSKLKDLIYKTFKADVTDRALGEVIH